MIMDQDDLDYEYKRLMERAYEIDGCVFVKKGLPRGLGKYVDKREALLARRPAHHDLTIRCRDGKPRKAHQIVFMKYTSSGTGGHIDPWLNVVRTCKSPGCINGQHLRTQTLYEREELKKLERKAQAEMTKEIRDALRAKVREEGLTDQEITAIYDSEAKTAEIAEMYGCSYVTIYRIKNGDRHSDVTGHVTPGREVRRDKRLKLTDDQIREIRAKRKAKVTLRKLAEEYGVSHVAIYKICEWTQRIDAGTGE